MTLLQLHLVAVSLWLGAVATETVLEFSVRDPGARRTVALAHRAIDQWVEIPFVTAVAVTGVALLARDWPGWPLLWVKIGAGLLALTAQVICIPLVKARARDVDGVRERALTRQIKLTLWGAPFALAAIAIGLEL